MTRVIVANSLIRTWIEGPAVSWRHAIHTHGYRYVYNTHTFSFSKTKQPTHELKHQ